MWNATFDNTHAFGIAIKVSKPTRNYSYRIEPPYYHPDLFTIENNLRAIRATQLSPRHCIIMQMMITPLIHDSVWRLEQSSLFGEDQR